MLKFTLHLKFGGFSLLYSLMPLLSVIQYEVGQKVGWAMMTLMVLAGIALVVVVLMQKSTGEDMSAISGYNQKNDSFFGKNKSQSSEGRLRKATVILAVLLLVLSIIYFVILSLSGR